MSGEHYVALYDYQATSNNGLNLRRGETVIVREKGNTGWYVGEGSLGVGWFPESYVSKQDPKEPIPLGWQVCTDEAGRVYYVDLISQQTSWTRPSAASKQPSTATAALSREPSQLALPPTSVRKSPSGDELEFSEKKEEVAPIEATVVEVEGKVFAVDPNGKIVYSDNFWGDKDVNTTGFDVLVMKHRNGKEVLKDIAEWMRERAAIEERYAKELQRLGKSPLADIEEGTMKTAWNQIKFDVDEQHRIRLGLAQNLLEQVEKPLIDFKDRQKKKRKDYESTIAKDRKIMAAKEEAAEKAKKLYMQKMKDADAADQLAAKSDSQSTKLSDTAKSERKKATQAGIDYKKAVDEYDVVRKQWEDDMNLACLDFQDAEEERVQNLKAILEAYLDSEKKVRDRLQSSADMVRTSVQAVSTEVDIEMFVKFKGTGARKPPPVTFKQYGSK